MTAISAKVGRPFLVSFSGLDGSGKSTQIAAATEFLEASGYTVRRLAFWDDAVVLTRYREAFVHRVYHSEPGIGAPDRPVKRRDKNMRSAHLTLARCLLYLLDAIHLRIVVNRQRDCDVLILDRYLYDELANLPQRLPGSRRAIRALARLAPRPDLAFLLDAEPEEARGRKPEYPLDFMRQCRSWYFRLAELLGGITIVPPLPLAAATEEVIKVMRQSLPARSQAPASPQVNRVA